MGNIFDRIGYKPEDVAEAVRLAEEAAVRLKLDSRDSRVCSCGHAARAHTSESDSDFHQMLKDLGRFECKPSAMVCPCNFFDPVLTSTNVRKFIYKTSGDQLHALTRGIESCRDGVGAGTISLDWLATTRCAVCKGYDGDFIAIAIGRDGVEVAYPSELNAIVHTECRGTQLKMG